jgi:HEPN domain-containing protein
VDRRDLQELSKVRLKEAKALMELGLYDGAYYLAGYAVECALKACIAKATSRGEFPDKKRVDLSHSHDLLQLIKVAGQKDEHHERIQGDLVFETNWEIVNYWSEQSRYRRNTRESAQALVSAVSAGRHGVISWIKQHW